MEDNDNNDDDMPTVTPTLAYVSKTAVRQPIVQIPHIIATQDEKTQNRTTSFSASGSGSDSGSAQASTTKTATLSQSVPHKSIQYTKFAKYEQGTQDESEQTNSLSTPTPTPTVCVCPTVNQYTFHGEIGRGVFSTVFLASTKDTTHTHTAHCVAIKRLSKLRLRRVTEYLQIGDEPLQTINGLQRIQLEVDVLCSLEHDHVVKLLEVIDDPQDDYVYLVLELADPGAIVQWNVSTLMYELAEIKQVELAVCDDIHSQCHQPSLTPLAFELNEHMIRTIFTHILSGMEYLHSNRIAHRDIRPDHFFAHHTVDGIVFMIGDFGSAYKFARDSSSKMSSTSCTHAFLSPQLCAGESSCAFQDDLWALGVSLFALCFGSVPWFHSNDMQLFRMIQKQALEFPTHCHSSSTDSISEPLKDLIKCMLTKDPERRPTIQQIWHHPWLTVKDNSDIAIQQ
jgi:serine/threonine protein kinase